MQLFIHKNEKKKIPMIQNSNKYPTNNTRINFKYESLRLDLQNFKYTISQLFYSALPCGLRLEHYRNNITIEYLKFYGNITIDLTTMKISLFYELRLTLTLIMTSLFIEMSPRAF